MYSLHLTFEQQEIRRTVRDFVKREIKPIALQRDPIEEFDRRFPRDVVINASKLGLRTLALSEKHGGGGADAITSCIVAEEMAVGDVGLAATLNQTSSLAREYFDLSMTDEQRARFLPAFLSDDAYHLAIATHEPDTDLGWCYHRPTIAGTGYKTTAVLDEQGNWLINGIKNFITNAPIAKLISVWCQVEPKSGGLAGVRSILVPTDTPGLTIREHDKVGRRLGSNGELVFDNVRVPGNNLLEKKGENLASGRSIPRFQALNLGIGRAAYEDALEFARMRVQGGRPIIEHQSVGLQLANMAIALEGARALIWKAAWGSEHPEAYEDGSLPDLPLQTIAKVTTSEVVMRVAMQAAEMFGGMGVMRDLPMQKYVRDAFIFMHSEQTNDVARMKVAEMLAGFRR
ncbi:MAG: acyl-CoA dehydrogenase family protein [Pseudorhodoplanes sp.]|uniref:acyl-CoA dehydrogenase family protein n=1 Tax=Pseudorhodoplanes sp. TaxID=1934341 RepID=UPI003D0F3971